MKAKVTVFLKPAVLDTQGRAVLGAAHRLGHEDVSDVRVGKVLLLDLKTDNQEKAKRMMDHLCAQLLSNPVIENSSYEFEG